MRTTYEFKNKELEGNQGTKKVQQQVQQKPVQQSVQQPVQQPVQQSPHPVRQVRQDQNPQQVQQVRQVQNQQQVQRPQQAQVGQEPLEPYVARNTKPAKSGGVGKVIVFILLFCIIAGGATVAYIKLAGNKLQEYQEKMNGVYTDVNKTDIKAEINTDYLQNLYAELALFAQKGEDITEVGSELDTISMYVQDRAVLNNISDIMYDFKTEGTEDELTRIQSGLDLYVVPGLKSSMSDYLNKVKAEYNEYISLVSEMQNIADYSTYDPSVYDARIQGITHEINKAELSNLNAGNVAEQQAQQEAAAEAAEAAEKATKKKKKKKKGTEESKQSENVELE